MRFQLTIFKDGEIHNTMTIVGFQKALRHAAREFSKELERLIVIGNNPRAATNYLTGNEWSGTITIVDDEVFGIQVQKVRVIS